MNKKHLCCAFLIASFSISAKQLNTTTTFTPKSIKPDTQLIKTSHVENAKNNAQNEEARGSTNLFFEDFTPIDPMNPSLPAGWAVFDLDGLTPNNSVSEFTEAWIVDEFPNNSGDFNIHSTSWYEPEGQADDWIITPAIDITAYNILSWRARAKDSNYPDGYEVYISTDSQTVADCQANPALFTIAQENGDDFINHNVNLGLAGFANQTVYICFRNNSYHQYILMIDDISVDDEHWTNDIQINAVSSQSSYSWVPSELNSFYIGNIFEVTNVGEAPLSDISYKVEIIVNGAVFDLIEGPLTNITINSGETLFIPLASYLTTVDGIYSIRYSVELNDVIDANPVDNTQLVENVVEVMPEILARDDNSPKYNISVTDGEGGYMGNMFRLFEPIQLSGVNFVYSNENCDTNPPYDCSLDGERIQVDVFAIDSQTGLPGAIVGSTEAHVVPAGISVYESAVVAFTTPLILASGEYVYAVKVPTRTVSTFDTIKLNLAASDSRFTPGTTWSNKTANLSTPWLNNEDWGPNVTYMIRPLFLPIDLIYADGFE